MTSTDTTEEKTFAEGWRANVFSLTAWRRHLIWFVAAAAAGGVALYFNYAERWSRVSLHFLDDISPLLPALLVTGGMILICRLRDTFFPGTEGTGIPQAIAALKMPDSARSAALSLRIATGKTLLLTIALFAGPTIGREGPSVHVGACLMYLCTKIVRFPAHLVRRGLILAGGAAGIAAAFNAPIAGIVFAFEEVGRSFEKDNAGTIIGGLFAQAVASVTPRISALSRQRPYVVAGSLGLALGVLGLISGGLTYGSGFVEAQRILIEGDAYPISYPFLKALASFVTLISGIPGGLFDPSLSVGAALGQLTHPVFPDISPQAVILLTMEAYFSGVVQSPLTSAVILFEMTASHHMALPLLVTSILAYEMSHLVCRTSLYESLADSFLKALPAEGKS